MWLAGYVNVSHERDSNLNISPKMSYGVLECDIVMLQDYMRVICNKGFLCALAGVAQWIEPQPATQRVMG